MKPNKLARVSFVKKKTPWWNEKGQLHPCLLFLPVSAFIFIIICIWLVETALIALDMIRDKTVRSPKQDFLFLFLFLGFLFLTRRVATTRHLFCGPSIVYVYFTIFRLLRWLGSIMWWMNVFWQIGESGTTMRALGPCLFLFVFRARAHRVRHYYFKNIY
jgi:hypothetical protein